jgi:hypothetical protein
MVDDGSGWPADVQIYPPSWYLQFVQRRLEAVREERGDGAQALPPVAEDDTELLLLAEEVIGLKNVADLPVRVRAVVLGLHVAEVRIYLRKVAQELGREPLASPTVAHTKSA